MVSALSSSWGIAIGPLPEMGAEMGAVKSSSAA